MIHRLNASLQFYHPVFLQAIGLGRIDMVWDESTQKSNVAFISIKKCSFPNKLDTQKCIFHHRKALRQWEEADDLLHCRWHNLNRQRRAGKDQHRLRIF